MAAPCPDNSLIATTGRGTSNVYLIDAVGLRVIGNIPNPQASDTTNKERITSGLLVGREPHEPTFRPDSFDAHEMHCKVLIARANKRGDYLAKFRCDDDLMQNYWFSLFNDRLYISETDGEP